MQKEEKKFQKLTPIKNADLGIYEEALDFVFKNDDIRNIAVSGPYSAGKSSIVETYEKTCANTKFFYISLANFDPTNENAYKKESAYKKPAELNEDSDGQHDFSCEKMLEGKILNQLIHQIDSKNIPQTNFKTKLHVSKKSIFFTTAATALLSVSLLYSFNFDAWKQYIDNLSVSCIKSILSFSTNSVCLLASGAIALLILGGFLFFIINAQKNKNLFKKLAFQGNEIEIFEQTEDSFFDKYLNEVLYIFENSGADVIVFEDIDRYNVTSIFQRLREINALVNKKRDKNRKRVKNKNKKRDKSKKPPLRFFYLLRDDVFVSKDRTKFFDFIIPIVPVLDSSNSYDQLREHFGSNNILAQFDESFLQGISLYIDDMRILKNIFNEFIIYQQRIGTTEQDPNKLLALIVYKNLFPRDFSNLQLNKGFVYTLFNSKRLFISEKQACLESQVEKNNEQIIAINNEIMKSEEELDTLYSDRKYKDVYGRTITPAYAEERNKRKEDVRLKKNNESDRIKKETEYIKKQIIELQNFTLSEIIDKENIDDIFKTCSTNEIGEIETFDDIKSNDYFDLLKYLIRNGYIDETYPDYMSHFYANSLARIDKIFLRSVTDQKPKEYNYSLKNPRVLISKLRIVDFEKEEILNFDLFRFLIANKDKYSVQLSKVLDLIKEKQKFDFVFGAINTDIAIPEFMREINHHWNSLFSEILSHPDYNQQQKKKFALLCLYHSPKEDLLLINSKNALSTFISQTSNFLDIDDPQTDTLIKALDYLGIHFETIDYDVSNQKLWSEVYARRLYVLNWEMIEMILEKQYRIPRSIDYSRKNLSLILSNPSEPLSAYVKDNINSYMQLMFNHNNERIDDNEETAIFVLNNSSIDDTNKDIYISKLQTSISDLYKIQNVLLWKKLIDNNLILYSEANVLRYFFENDYTFDSTLVQFINQNANSYTFYKHEVFAEYDEDSESKFFNASVKCNDLHNNHYRSIVKSMNRYYFTFSTKNIDEEKVRILINLKTIRMNTDTLIFMREYYPNLMLHFIVNNPNEYVTIIDEDTFLMSEALEVLESEINISYKQKLLKITNEPISITNKHYSGSIQTHILQHNFDKQDLAYLLQNYDVFSPNPKNEIERIAIENIQTIITIGLPITYSLLLKLLQNVDIKRTDRMNIFSFSVSELNQNQCKECLSALKAIEYLSLFNGKRPEISATDVNERILNVFKKKAWITKYEKEGETSFRVIGRKNRFGKN